jgi:hypothetical protein
MTESVVVTLGLPLPLPTLMQQGARLRRRFEVRRPKRPLQIKRRSFGALFSSNGLVGLKALAALGDGF